MGISPDYIRDLCPCLIRHNPGILIPDDKKILFQGQQAQIDGLKHQFNLIGDATLAVDDC